MMLLACKIFTSSILCPKSGMLAILCSHCGDDVSFLFVYFFFLPLCIHTRTSICLSVYLYISIYWSIHLFIYLFFCLLIHMSSYLSITLSFYLFIYLSVDRSMHTLEQRNRRIKIKIFLRDENDKGNAFRCVRISIYIRLFPTCTLLTKQRLIDCTDDTGLCKFPPNLCDQRHLPTYWRLHPT